MNVLMALAAVGAVGIGDYAEGAWVLVLFAVGTTLEAMALDRSRRSVEALMELAPDEAHVRRRRRRAHRRGRRGRSRAPRSSCGRASACRWTASSSTARRASTSPPLTGESVPVDKAPATTVFAGTLNAYRRADGARRPRPRPTSTLARVARLVEQAQGSRAPDRAVHRPLRADLHAARVRRRAAARGRPVAAGRRRSTPGCTARSRC